MKQPAKSSVPYGLFALLAVYGLLVLGYVWQTYWTSPEYLAAEHFEQAGNLLGLDDGRKASQETLTRAYVHYLEAARLMPQVELLHKRVEAMRWRFEERGFKMDHDLAMRAEAVALVRRRMQEQEAPLLVVGARDRGWVAGALLDGPRRAVWISLPGAAGLVLVWVWLRFFRRRSTIDFERFRP